MTKFSVERGFGGHTSKKTFKYLMKDGSVVFLQSSYELRMAEILDVIGVIWSRHPPLNWVDDCGRSHKYYPDFLVNGTYYDTKNDYLAIKDIPKINAVKRQNSVNVIILRDGEINEKHLRSLVK
jgi:hypothetical protein